MNMNSGSSTKTQTGLRHSSKLFHLDGDGEQLSPLIQVEEAQRSGQVRLLPIGHVGRDAVQNLIVQQVDVPVLSHGHRMAVSETLEPTTVPGQRETCTPVAPAPGRSLQAGRGGACQR